MKKRIESSNEDKAQRDIEYRMEQMQKLHEELIATIKKYGCEKFKTSPYYRPSDIDDVSLRYIKDLQRLIKRAKGYCKFEDDLLKDIYGKNWKKERAVA
jgi:hypothetical protein